MLKENFKEHLSSVFFWAVISAAFIGPGTVTTAASSGSSYGFRLVWVLVLSTIMCIVLQVNVTKITIETGKTFGELLLHQFSRHIYMPMAIGFSIVFGCMAYQAGNLLGAALGIGMLLDLGQSWIVLIISLIAGLMLWFGTVKLVIRILGVVVALMGMAFIFIIFSMQIDLAELLSGIFVPVIPNGSEILVMGLIGTTIVPYNLFLGSGLSIGKSLRSSKIGLTGAIAIGGMISIAVLLAGTMVDAPLDFKKLAAALSLKLGPWANYLLAFGLFAAGFTSSITAPLAAVYTLRGIFPQRKDLIEKTSIGYRGVWGIVMTTGLVFAFINVKPIPLIILAQAVNGIILPFVVSSILFLTLRKALKEHLNLLTRNSVAMSIVSFFVISLGAFNLIKLLGMANIAGIFIAAFFGLVIVVMIIMISRK